MRRLHHWAGWSLVCAGWLSVAPAVASPSAAEDPPPCVPSMVGALNPSSACETLFGDELVQRRNREARLETLESITAETGGYWLVHRGDWTTPQLASTRSLVVVETVHGAGCTPVAIIALDDPTGASECAEGLYSIEVDDDLGSEARVLAILDDLVLVEVRDQLVYVLAPGATAPEWRIVWHAPWTLQRSRPSGNSGAQSGAPPAKPPPRPRR